MSIRVIRGDRIKRKVIPERKCILIHSSSPPPQWFSCSVALKFRSHTHSISTCPGPSAAEMWYISGSNWSPIALRTTATYGVCYSPFSGLLESKKRVPELVGQNYLSSFWWIRMINERIMGLEFYFLTCWLFFISHSLWPLYTSPIRYGWGLEALSSWVPLCLLFLIAR